MSNLIRSSFRFAVGVAFALVASGCGSRTGILGGDSGSPAPFSPAWPGDDASVQDGFSGNDALADQDAGAPLSDDGSGDMPPDAANGSDADIITNCAATGNILFVNGVDNEFIISGSALIQGSPWLIDTSVTDGGEFYQLIVVTPITVYDGPWDVSVWSEDESVAITPGMFQTVFPPVSGVLGFAVTGNGHACDVTDAILDIRTVQFDATGKLVEFLASFEQYCGEGDLGMLYGCVRVGQ
jgi:hypothetical protein